MKSMLSNKITFWRKNKNATALIISLIFHCLLLVFLGQFMLEGQKLVALPVKLVMLNSQKKSARNHMAKGARGEEPSKSMTNATQNTQAAKTIPKVEKVIKKITGIIHSERPSSNSVTSVETDSKSLGLAGSGTSGVPDRWSSGGGSNNAATNGNSTEGKVENLQDVIVIHKEIPKYPVFSRKMREEGTVLLLLTVKNGVVSNVSIEKSSGFSRLDASAQTAAKKWRFESKTKFLVKVPFSFKLSN